MFNLNQFEALLATTVIGRTPNNEFWDSIDSTNSRVATLAGEGAEEGTVVFARRQTKGRGRLGRQWLSPPDSGLYMSLLLRPEKSVGEIPIITLAIGVATAKAILAKTGLKVGLKWVNDLVFDRKKIGGILAEMLTPGGERIIVVGLGINISFQQDEIPEELGDKLTWLNQLLCTECNTNALAAEICFQIEDVYNKMQRGQSKEILEDWRAFSVTLGQEIVSTTPARELRGTALDISDNGALIIQTAQGKEELFGGEISIRSKDGSYS